MILIDFFLVLGIIKIFVGLSDDIIAGIIGFVGSVIGGTLTLIGVKWTITEQNKKDFIDKYPEKIKYFHKIDTKLYKLRTAIMEYKRPTISFQSNNEINDFLISKDELILYSGKINGEIYGLIIGIFDFIFELKELARFNTLNPIQQKEWEFYVNLILSNINYIYEEMDKMHRKFKEYAKVG